MTTSQEKKAVYPEYMSPLMVNAGIKSGELHQGHFSANPHNYLEVHNISLLSTITDDRYRVQ
jgi:hypothetical protein